MFETIETVIVIAICLLVAVAFSEYESKKEKQMEKRKRPCQFTIPGARKKFPEQKTMNGLFHQFGTSHELGRTAVTVAIVEDPDGNIHKVDPEMVQFTDK